MRLSKEGKTEYELTNEDILLGFFDSEYYRSDVLSNGVPLYVALGKYIHFADGLNSDIVEMDEFDILLRDAMVWEA